MFIDVFIRPDDELRPQFKKKEIKKIVDLANKLIIATHKSSEALSASFFTVQTKLSEEIIKHNPEKSRMIGFDTAPILSWAFISGVIDVLKLNAEDESLEPLEWDLWSHDKKSAWILSDSRYRFRRYDISLVSKSLTFLISAFPEFFR